jgi:hypothetical protein
MLPTGLQFRLLLDPEDKSDVLLKRYLTATGLSGVISQQTELLTVIAVRISNTGINYIS